MATSGGGDAPALAAVERSLLARAYAASKLRSGQMVGLRLAQMLVCAIKRSAKPKTQAGGLLARLHRSEILNFKLTSNQNGF